MAGMTEPPVRYLPGRPAVGLAATAVVTAGLVALAALGAALLSVRDLDPVGLLAVAVLGGSARAARRAWVRLRVTRTVRTRVPARLLLRRWHGDHTVTGADEYRALRPIGMTRAEAVRRTEDLLRPLTDIPSVRIFRGVRAADGVRAAGATDGAAPGPTLAAFAVTAGRLVLVVEPVAWPPGRYLLDATGGIRCDGRFIGQSVGPLVSGVVALRARLPRTHRVRALVVVHPIADGAVGLPVPTKDVAWTLAPDLPTTMRTALARHPRTVSRHTVAALAPDD
jgi:hypothetical protein